MNGDNAIPKTDEEEIDERVSMALQRMAPQTVERLNVQAVAERRQCIVDLMQTCMQEGVDYGVIPGCAKPTLYQPGAQKLINLFQIDPELETMPDSVLQADFILHSYKCTLYSIASGKRIASGAGSCNSREEKYGKRTAKRTCPECGKQTIIKGRKEYGGGWLCWAKAGKSDGCGAKFRDGDPVIEGQPEGKIDNENIWEQENTIRKMAMKRSLVSAVLNATGASDIFTQDVEDMAEFQGGAPPETKPHHREGNEHYTTFCEQCQEAGVPKDLKAVLSHGQIYVKTLKGEALNEIYKESAGTPPASATTSEPTQAKPAAAGADSQAAPAHSHNESKASPRKAVSEGDMKEFLERMGRAKEPYPEGIGKDNYYRILGVHGLEHANEAKQKGLRQKVRDAMAECYRDIKGQRGEHTFPDEHVAVAELVKQVITQTGVAESTVMRFCQSMVNGGTHPLTPKDENITRTILQGLLRESTDAMTNRLARY